MGSAPYYVAAVALYRMFERPFVLSGIGIFWGYLKAWLKRVKRFDNPDYLRFFRRYELESLLFGKRRTMNKYHDRVRKEFPPPLERFHATSSCRPAVAAAAPVAKSM